MAIPILQVLILLMVVLRVDKEKLECCVCNKHIGYFDPYYKDSETPGWVQGNEYCIECGEK